MDNDEATTVCKRDALGRVKVPKAQREVLLDEFERNGLSGTKFAAVAGVNYQTFASWAQKQWNLAAHAICSEQLRFTKISMERWQRIITAWMCLSIPSKLTAKEEGSPES